MGQAGLRTRRRPQPKTALAPDPVEHGALEQGGIGDLREAAVVDRGKADRSAAPAEPVLSVAVGEQGLRVDAQPPARRTAQQPALGGLPHGIATGLCVGTVRGLLCQHQHIVVGSAPAALRGWGTLAGAGNGGVGPQLKPDLFAGAQTGPVGLGFD